MPSMQAVLLVSALALHACGATASNNAESLVHPKPPKLPKWAQDFRKDLTEVSNKGPKKDDAAAQPVQASRDRLPVSKFVPAASKKLVVISKAEPPVQAHVQSNVVKHPTPPKLPQWAKEFRNDLTKLSNEKRVKGAVAAKASEDLHHRLPAQSMDKTALHSSVITSKPTEVSVPIHVAVQATSEKHPIPPKLPQWAQEFRKDLTGLSDDKKTKHAVPTDAARASQNLSSVTQAKSSGGKQFASAANKTEAPKHPMIPSKLKAAPLHAAAQSNSQKHPKPPNLPEWAQHFRSDLTKLTNKKIAEDGAGGLKAARDQSSAPKALDAAHNRSAWLTNKTNGSHKSAVAAKPQGAAIPAAAVPRTPVIVSKPEQLPPHAAVSVKASTGTKQALKIFGTKRNPKNPFDPANTFMVKAASACQCEFKGMCSCHASMEFMNCIAEACQSGRCDCANTHYMNACTDMASTCEDLDFECTTDRAICLSELENDWTTTTKGPLSNDAIYKELKLLKEKKCRLELAERDGWLNAGKQLAAVQRKIGDFVEDLDERRAKVPEMHCEKHFEEWHEPPKDKDSESSALRALVPSAFFPMAFLLGALA